MGSPASQDLIHILLSGETQDAEPLAFSFVRFTEVDPELAKFYSLSWREISFFSPKVLCWSQTFCIWKQTAFSKLILLWPQNLTCLFSPLESQFPKQWPCCLFTSHRRRRLQTPLGQQFSTGWFCPPGDIWQYLGALLSPTVTGIQQDVPRKLLNALQRTAPQSPRKSDLAPSGGLLRLRWLF